MLFSFTLDQWTNVIACNGRNFQEPFLSLWPPGIPFLQLGLYLSLFLFFFFFFALIFFLAAPNSSLHGIIFGRGGTYTAAHQTPHRLNLSVSEGEAGHLIALAGAKRGKKAETGLVLMTDNPVTNSWSSSKGLLSRLWLCDVDGTWSSGSPEAKRKGF